MYWCGKPRLPQYTELNPGFPHQYIFLAHYEISKYLVSPQLSFTVTLSLAFHLKRKTITRIDYFFSSYLYSLYTEIRDVSLLMKTR
jgi:hypothetical protein